MLDYAAKSFESKVSRVWQTYVPGTSPLHTVPVYQIEALNLDSEYTIAVRITSANIFDKLKATQVIYCNALL